MVKSIATNSFRAIILADFRYSKDILLGLVLLITALLPINGRYYSIKAARASDSDKSAQVYRVFLPILYNVNYSAVPRVNIPKIENNQGEFLPEESAVFWFGKVTPTENYADVRIGYTPSSLWVWISIIDRRLWYDESPTPEDLTKWDSSSLFLNVDGNGHNFTFDNTYRFDAQLNWWEGRENWQAAYQASSAGWRIQPINFETHTNWYGFPEPNDDQDDRAWLVEYIIPYQSLGFADTPPEGTEWRMGVQIHDRDDFAGAPIADKVWPENMLPDFPITWGMGHYRIT